MRHEVKTIFGEIIVKESVDKNYPGVFVDFKQNGSDVERPIVVVECDKNEDNPNGCVRALVYGQKGEGSEDLDYTNKFEIFGQKEKEEMEKRMATDMEENVVLDSLNLPSNFKVLEGDRDTIYVKERFSGKTFEIKVNEISD